MATVIIPALNEAPRVGAVIRAAAAARSVEQIIVVDDGSTDGTADVAAAHGARVVRLARNGGKGGALAAGAAAAGGGTLVLLDADLRGLTPAHVEALAAPVAGGRAAMSIGVMPASAVNPQWAARWQSGQRAIGARTLAGVPDLGASGYGAEVAMTRAVEGAGGRIEYVPFDGVTCQGKAEKWGLAAGVAAGIRMRIDQVATAARLRPWAWAPAAGLVAATVVGAVVAERLR